MYKLSNVQKSFLQGKSKINVLSGIDLVINSGDFLAIMGSSGAGKTTLINILTMIEDYDDGIISFRNKNFRDYKNKERDQYRKKDISIIFQDYNLINEMTVWENIYLGKLLSDEEKSDLNMKQIIDLLDIDKLLSKYPEELSGGEKQRVAIARSLLNNSRCIFADEPTGALNRKNSIAFLEILRKLNKEWKRTIVMVTHDPYVASYSNRFVYLKDGKILEEFNFKGIRKEYYDNILQCLEENDV